MRIRRISGLMPPAVVHPVEWYGVDKALGAQPVKPPEPPPDNADWSGYAERRKVEGDLQSAARKAELLPVSGKLDPMQQVLAASRRAGLSQSEVLQLRQHLTSIRPDVLAEDLKFLRATVLRCPQPLQAMRSFLEMIDLAGKNPLRIRRDMALTLVTAVSEKGAGKSRKSTGVPLAPEEASSAAKALAGMTDTDFGHASQILDAAEEQPDRARILRAIATRHDSLVNPAIQDLFRNMAGLSSYYLGEVEAYAAELLSQTGEVKPENTGVLSVNPAEYLQEGFFTPDQELRSGIYGFCSAAMARRCREEGTSLDTVRELVDVVSRIGEELYELAGADPELPLDDSTHASIQALLEMNDSETSPALRELLNAAEPWLQQFRDLAALAVHLERILRYMVS